MGVSVGPEPDGRTATGPGTGSRDPTTGDGSGNQASGALNLLCKLPGSRYRVGSVTPRRLTAQEDREQERQADPRRVHTQSGTLGPGVGPAPAHCLDPVHKDVPQTARAHAARPAPAPC